MLPSKTTFPFDESSLLISITNLYLLIYPLPFGFILRESFISSSVCLVSGSDGKESTCSVGDLGLIHGSGRSPGEGNDNPLQYSCLENPMDRGAWRLQSMELQRVRHD